MKDLELVLREASKYQKELICKIGFRREEYKKNLKFFGRVSQLITICNLSLSFSNDDNIMVFAGAATKYYKDNDDVVMGWRFALNNALISADLDREDRTKIWEAFNHELQDMKSLQYYRLHCC